MSDETVQQASVGDAQARRVPGFPYLRIDRFLASFTDDDLAPAGFQVWMERMRKLDLEGRDKEYRALSAAERARLGPGRPTAENLWQRARACGERMYWRDMSEPRARARLLKVARVPSDYVLWQQILGLYPLTALGVLQGVLHYHSEVEETYAMPLKELAVQGRLVRFMPPINDRLLTSGEVAGILQLAVDNPLRIPNLDRHDRRLLFAAFAPVWEVDVATEADRIGMPYWEQMPEVNVREPVVFTHLSYGRLGGEILLQLNYVIWFPARPRTGALDLLGGRLDGIVWRVTLATDGQPLVYDSVHNCGCYHRFFPTPRLRLVRRHVGFEEPVLVPQRVRLDPSRKVLRIASSNHSVQRVYSANDKSPAANAKVRYRFADYDLLRALPAGQRYRSLFGPHGIVPHTERRERCLLWPTGVENPGAMRQWGRHAVAFVGERYFDAPRLIERYFEIVPAALGDRRASDN